MPTPICVQPWPEDDVRLLVLSDLQDRLGDFLLVGAHARDLICHEIVGVARAMPRTSDVDIAIVIQADGARYDERVAALDSRRFRSAMRFATPVAPAVPVDVIPCGPGVTDVANIRLDRDRSLDATGMAEAMACAAAVRVHPTLTLRIPPLHAAVALKLIAHGLRVELGEHKDARDLDLLMEATYDPEMATADCYAHMDVAPDDFDFDVELVGPWLAGVRMARDFPAHIERLAAVCHDPRLPGLMVADPRRPAMAPGGAARRAQIAALRRGILGGSVAVQPWLAT